MQTRKLVICGNQQVRRHRRRARGRRLRRRRSRRCLPGAGDALGLLPVRAPRVALPQRLEPPAGARLGFGDFDGDGKTDVFSQRAALAGSSPPGARAHGRRSRPARRSTSSASGSATSTATARPTSSGRTARGSSSRAPAQRSGSRSRVSGSRSATCASATSTATARPTSSASQQPVVGLLGGNTKWRRLNRKLSSSSGSLAFADFNGDRKTDVARTAAANGRSRREVRRRGRRSSSAARSLCGRDAVRRLQRRRQR